MELRRAFVFCTRRLTGSELEGLHLEWETALRAPADNPFRTGRPWAARQPPLSSSVSPRLGC